LPLPPNPYQSIESTHPGRIGWRIHYFGEVDTTQRVAAELASGGSAHGTVVIAERQTAGRGRLGRTWHSPAGVNLYTTVILRPTMPPAEVPRLTLVAGAAVAEALETLAPGIVALKWPNDVWLRGRKAGGIIAEAVTDSAHGLRCVLLGIGLNLNLGPDDIPDNLRRTASSLLIETGRKCDRVKFADVLFSMLDRHCSAAEKEGFAAVRPLYQHYFALNGRRVAVLNGAERVSGIVRGIDEDGALLLETDHGPTRILTGDVSLEGAYD
jgi:BirA family biotin operon repressor/biotin-[acetyl-CoA-carboxylase] ligase